MLSNQLVTGRRGNGDRQVSRIPLKALKKIKNRKKNGKSVSLSRKVFSNKAYIVEKKKDPTTKYAIDVLNGDIVTGRYLKLAAKRHLQDIENANEIGYYFDKNAAEHCYGFYDIIHDRSGNKLKLFRWQYFFLGSLEGWKSKETGNNRFRNSLLLSSRSSGKTILLAGYTIFKLMDNKDQNVRSFILAGSREQSGLLFDDVTSMIRNSDELREFFIPPKSEVIRPLKHVLRDRFSSIEMKASSASFKNDDFSRLSGWTVGGAIIAEEYSAWKTGKPISMMRSAFKDAKNPVLILDSNCGNSLQSPLGLEWNRAIKILKGKLLDDRYFPLLFAVDKKDDPFKLDHKTKTTIWPKANPALLEANIPTLEYLEGQVNEASVSPLEKQFVGTKNFSIWGDGEIEASFFQPELVNRLFIKEEEFPSEEELKEMDTVIGVDLSQGSDLSGLSIIHIKGLDNENDDIPTFYIDNHIFCSQKVIKNISQEHIPFAYWGKKGYINIKDRDWNEWRDIVEKIVYLRNDMVLNIYVEICIEAPYLFQNLKRLIWNY